MYKGDPSCRFCELETQTMQHLVCCCEAFSCQRYNVLGGINYRTKCYTMYSCSQGPVSLYQSHRVI